MERPRFEDHEQHVRAMIDAAMRSADPRAGVREACRTSPPPSGRFAVLAVGKAAAPMLAGLRDALPGERRELVIVPEGSPAPPGALAGDHPMPTDRNIENATRARRFVESAAGAGVEGLIVLLSGGTSALLTLPAERIDRDEYRRLTEALLRDGKVTIRELNTVRKHCERLKGGRFAELLGPLWAHVYVLSDVIGDALDVIGSGPFAPDGTTFLDALKVVDACPDAPPGVRAHLLAGLAGEAPETPKPGDAIFARVRHVVVGNNEKSARAAAAAAGRVGLRIVGSALGVEGEAADVARRFARQAISLQPGLRPACLVLGGETTVSVGTAPGRGGRNQEFALAAAIEIDGAPRAAIATFATDGADGPTDAAGAIVTGETCRTARELGLDPADFLRRHDSHGFFQKVGGYIRTGPTGTNVNDLAIALVY